MQLLMYVIIILGILINDLVKNYLHYRTKLSRTYLSRTQVFMDIIIHARDGLEKFLKFWLILTNFVVTQN